MKLAAIAQVMRSKNAGPRRLTRPVMFGSDTDYQRVVQPPALGTEAIGRPYRVPAEQVTIIPYPAGRAIRIMLPRGLRLQCAETRFFTIMGPMPFGACSPANEMTRGRYDRTPQDRREADYPVT